MILLKNTETNQFYFRERQILVINSSTLGRPPKVGGNILNGNKSVILLLLQVFYFSLIWCYFYLIRVNNFRENARFEVSDTIKFNSVNYIYSLIVEIVENEEYVRISVSSEVLSSFTLYSFGMTVFKSAFALLLNWQKRSYRVAYRLLDLTLLNVFLWRCLKSMIYVTHLVSIGANFGNAQSKNTVRLHRMFDVTLTEDFSTL